MSNKNAKDILNKYEKQDQSSSEHKSNTQSGMNKHNGLLIPNEAVRNNQEWEHKRSRLKKIIRNIIIIAVGAFILYYIISSLITGGSLGVRGIF